VRIFKHPQVHREHFEAGEEVFRQGDVGDRIYFVIEGEAEVVIDDRVTDSIGPGSVFGEIALMNDRPRTATIRARSAMSLASVQRDAFHTLVAHFPGVRAAMDEILAAHVTMPATRTSEVAPPIATSAD
jgi:NADH dehydrogenase